MAPSSEKWNGFIAIHMQSFPKIFNLVPLLTQWSNFIKRFGKLTSKRIHSDQFFFITYDTEQFARDLGMWFQGCAVSEEVSATNCMDVIEHASLI
jgi:hypothetical protein